MYKVVFSKTATKDISAAVLYIKNELKNPKAAEDLFNAIEERAKSLAQMPERHAIINNSRLINFGIRSVPVKNYIIFYNIDKSKNTVNIIRFISSRRDWHGILSNTNFS